MLRLGKQLYQQAKYRNDEQKSILFVVGCQRSGTDLITRIFDEDWSTKVYPEVSKLSSRDTLRKLRLNPLPEVKAEFEKAKGPLIVLKPLVESQNTLKLLDYFPGSKALWMYRNYKAVARSRVKKQAGENLIRDLRAIVQRKPNNWRYENVSDELHDVVVRNFAENMNRYDAAALYWFVRNRLFFDLQLDKNPHVMICQYEELVRDPANVVRKIYSFLGHYFPGDKVVREVNMGSLYKGQDIYISPAIERICDDLLSNLDAVWLGEPK